MAENPVFSFHGFGLSKKKELSDLILACNLQVVSLGKG